MDMKLRLLRRSRRMGECLEWTGYCEPKDGYAVITVGSHQVRRIQRVAYEVFIGPIPKAKYVLHHCDNRRCFEPSHLFLGDAKANALDCKAKNRHGRGERNGMSVFLERDIVEIRRRYAGGEFQSNIARSYGVDQTTISQITRRFTWKHVA